MGLCLYVLARYTMNAGISWLVYWHVFGGAILGVPFCKRTFGVLFWTKGGLNRQHLLMGYYAIGVLCYLSGIAMLIWAALGASIGRLPFVFVVHIWAGIVAIVLAIIGFGVRRTRGHGRNVLADGRFASPGLVLIILAPTAGLGAISYHSDHYFRLLTATNARQADNSNFPSGAIIHQPGDWKNEPCGESGCHVDIQAQWQMSSHAKSASSAAYVDGLYRISKESGADTSRWCKGCHEPLSAAVATNSTRDKSQPGDSGITCISCHAMSHVEEATGNGRADYSSPAVYPFLGLSQDRGSKLHDFLIRLRPLPHRQSLNGPAEGGRGERMCAPCHRMSVTAAQNHYRFVRTDDAWGQWQSSPSSGETLHNFTASSTSRSCAGCHFKKTAGTDPSGHLIDHSNGNGKQPAIIPLAATHTRPAAAFNGNFHIEVFALRRSATEAGGVERVDAPLSDRPVFLTPGERVALDVLVENRGIGHSFPLVGRTGADEWLELRITDRSGRTLLQDGPANGNRHPLDAHHYGELSLDRNGIPTAHVNSQDTVAVVYRNLSQTDVADVVRYRFVVPAKVDGSLHVSARLLLDRPTRDNSSEPKFTVLADHSVQLGLRTDSHERTASLDPGGIRDDPRRAPSFRTYGFALLEQRDLLRARRALQQARSLMPNDAENSIAIGRANLEEGDLLGARENLTKALQLAPGSPRATAWLGHTLRLMGQSEQALQMLEPLGRTHPRDSATWLDIGLCYFSMGRYLDATEPFNHMLEIDPDNEVGHFELMQCYRKLRRLSDARREEAIYRALHIDSPPALVQRFLNAHPDAAREAQPIHEHLLRPAQ